MPELPDLTVYVEALSERLAGQQLIDFRLASPFVLRSVSPPPQALIGRKLVLVGRLGKQIVFDFGQDHFCVVHLMIAGRFRWQRAGRVLPRRSTLAAWDFPQARLVLTEVSKNKRAAIRIVQGQAALEALDRGGLEPLAVDLAQVRQRLQSENHTLKRALTDQRLLAGIGNAYSDEILLAAQLSPFQRTQDLSAEQWGRLFQATRQTLMTWTDRLRQRAGDGFPARVTAFHPEMAVHGRYGKPCPICAAPVQRIVYADNEASYCARCQTGGRILADRALSRLLKDDWPRRLEDLESSDK